jgi:hypothetical protein
VVVHGGLRHLVLVGTGRVLAVGSGQALGGGAGAQVVVHLFQDCMHCKYNFKKQPICANRSVLPYIFEFLEAGVVEVHPGGEGDMRDDVLVVGHAIRAQGRCGEHGISFVAHSWLTEVVHADVIASIQQV